MTTTPATTSGHFIEGDKQATLDNWIGRRVSLNCSVGVCIWGAMFTLEPGHGLCQYDCVRGELRVGISHQIVSRLWENPDGSLSIVIN